MVLKLYGGNRMSMCTQRITTVLREKEIPYELYIVDLAKGEHKSPEYLEKQPFGQIPYIDDDGVIIYESRAIARYIDAKWPNHGPRLSVPPTDCTAFGLYEQACSNEISNFDSFASEAVLHLIIWPAFEMQTDKKYAEGRLKALERKLDAYDVILSKQKYLAGDEYTLADLFHLPYGTMLPACGFTALEDGSRPNVARWWKDISSRPAWLATKEATGDDIKI